MNDKLTHQRHDITTGLPGKAAIIELRERFLDNPAQTDLSTLRPVIARSWRRSMLCQVSPAQSTLDLIAEPRLDARTLQTTQPILDDLRQLCVDVRGLVMLADANGTIADFRGDPMMVRRAEKCFPLRGGCMSEDRVGTNSDGTAIEEGNAVQVWGAEHFNNALQDTYCTSVLIRDPIRRSIRGILSLTFPERLVRGIDPRAILLILQGAASRINSALAASLMAREQSLLSEYLRDMRKRDADAVIAMDARTTIANRNALQLLDQSDLAVLAGYAREIQQLHGPVEQLLSCGPEKSLYLQARPVAIGDAQAGAVMRLRKVETRTGRSRPAGAPGRKDPFANLVGNSPAFKRAIEGAATAVARDIASCYIVGEAGTGKRLLAEAMASRLGDRTRIHHCQTIEPDNPPDLNQVLDTLEPGGVEVFHRVDCLPAPFLEQLASRLAGLEQPRVIATCARVDDALLPLISSMQGIEIQMPPLRIRRDDIALLVAYFLQFHSGATPLRISSRLLEILTGAEWPGNVRQLRDVIEAAALRAAGSVIRPEDLTEVHRRALARTRLSRLQKAELEQIRDALVEAGGNRLRAAKILRIGRSTLYRKIDSYTARGFDIDVCA